MARFWLGDAEIDTTRASVSRGADVRRLSPAEAELLAYLHAHAGRAVPRSELLTEVWRYHARSRSRTVDSTLARLRAKVEPDPDRPAFLRSARGQGIELRNATSEAVAEAWRVRAAYPEPEVLVGRQEALDALRSSVERNGLVTLIGPGGVGKSSLARTLLRAWDDGRSSPVFADLSAATTRVAVAATTAAALGCLGSADAEEQARSALGRLARPLLVADNVEQLPSDALLLLAEWATLAPVVATSRQPTDLPGERVHRLLPLGPDASASLLDRCLDASGRSAPRSAVELAVRCAGGLPLGLKLLASVLDLLPGALASHALDVEDPDHHPDRHRSLRVVLQTSWHRLSEGDRAVLNSAAAFHAGFDVEALATMSDRPVPATLRTLSRLRDRSWLQVDGGELSLLVPVRQFVIEQGDAPTLRARLRGWCEALREPLLVHDDARGRRHKEDLSSALIACPEGRRRSLLELVFCSAYRHDWAPEAAAMMSTLRATGPEAAYLSVLQTFLRSRMVLDLPAPPPLDEATVEALGPSSAAFAECIRLSMTRWHSVDETREALEGIPDWDDPLIALGVLTLLSQRFGGAGPGNVPHRGPLTRLRERALARGWTYVLRSVDAMLAIYDAVEGQVDPALTTLDRLGETSAAPAWHLDATRAWVLMGGQRLDAAAVVLERLIDKARRSGQRAVGSSTHTNLCVVRWAQGDDAALRALLSDAPEHRQGMEADVRKALAAWLDGVPADLPAGSGLSRMYARWLAGEDPNDPGAVSLRVPLLARGLVNRPRPAGASRRAPSVTAG